MTNLSLENNCSNLCLMFETAEERENCSEQCLIRQMTFQRNQLLVESDWTVLPDAPTDKTAWTQYRQELRDFPNTWTPSTVIDLPEPPV